MRLPDRRQDVRLMLYRQAKLQCEESGRYLPAKTINVSSGGALLELVMPTRLWVGQRVRVGIATTPTQPIIHAGEMTPATVVRADGLSARVAVAFDVRQALSRAA